MTKLTQAQRVELADIREAMNRMDDEYVSAHWDRFLELKNIEAQEYREENQEKFDKFYKEHIQGKRWEEIDTDDWQTYSDWHKDMYGYRPHFI